MRTAGGDEHPTYRSYLRFTVTGLAGPVSGVKLRLWVSDASPNIVTSSRSPDTTWIESGNADSITWTSKPAMGGTQLGSAAVPTLNGYNEITLDPGAVGGNGLVSFGLTIDGTNSAIFSSREGANHPQLVVTSAAGPVDLSPPNLTAAAVNGATLRLTYDEALDTGSTPAPGDYAILVNGVARAVGAVAVGGSTATLTLASPVISGDLVTASYVVPARGPIQDLAGNDAASFSGQAVTNTTPPTGGGGGGMPRFSHVYLIILENKTIDQIIGSPSAPYLNQLADRYGVATAWSALADTSQPNYIALFSGSLQGVTSNGTVDLPGRSLADQIDEAGLSWRVYAENAPTNCFTGSSASGGPDGSGTYARKHEPAISFDRIRTDPARCANITDFSHFVPGTASFNLIVPNLCHDMHDCTVADGDLFMSTFVPRIIGDPSWGTDDLLVVTFDEGIGSDRHIATLVVSDRVPAGYRSAVVHDHYTFVWTVESAWGLPCLNLACSANTISEFFP